MALEYKGIRQLCVVIKRMSTETLSALESAVLAALKQGDRNRGELADLTQTAYAELVPTLHVLKRKRLIESYFQAQAHLPILTYRLVSVGGATRFLGQASPDSIW